MLKFYDNNPGTYTQDAVDMLTSKFADLGIKNQEHSKHKRKDY
jgi:hypothetical protein